MQEHRQQGQRWIPMVVLWSRLLLTLSLGGGAVYELVAGHPSVAGLGAVLAFLSASLNRLERR